MELSMDQNHVVSRLERQSCDAETISGANKSIDMLAGGHTSSIATQQIGTKLQELESRIKQKFSNIKSLEGLLDTILGKQTDRPALIG